MKVRRDMFPRPICCHADKTPLVYIIILSRAFTLCVDVGWAVDMHVKRYTMSVNGDRDER